MSRLLLASTARLFQNLRKDRLLLRRSMAAKPKKVTKIECTPDIEEPKPGYFKSGGTHAVLNDLPLPQGDYQQWWNDRNSRYNLVLYTGLIALVGTVVVSLYSGLVQLYCFRPDYIYTEEEIEEFEKREEEKIEEAERKKQLHADRVYEREQSIKRREAKKAQDREVELMTKDLEEGLSESELATLQSLITEREIYEKETAIEEKRRKEELQQREKDKKEKEKLKMEKAKQKQKERDEKKKAAAKAEKEREKDIAKAKKERQKQEAAAEKLKAKNQG